MDWKHDVIAQLAAARQWITLNRTQRSVLLGGERRLSTSIAIGSQFPAVAGFNIDLEYRGAIWSTDSHPQKSDLYEIAEKHTGRTGGGLVVAIGICRDISESVNVACVELGLTNCPKSYFHGSEAITTDRHANQIVQSLKEVIRDRIHETGAERIHLFIACPAPLALFFGHRLNATAEIQCYEWTGLNKYVPTCVLCT